MGNEVVNGFNPAKAEIELDTADFANFATVMADASQVGPNTVITQAGGAGTITLDGVAKSSLTAANFTFFNGAAADTITITGIPDGSTLSAGTNNGGGSWTLTSAQLAGLMLDAGEPTTTGLPADLTVTVTNPASQAAQMVSAPSQTINLTVNPVPPNVAVTVLPANPTDPATLTRLQIAAQADDLDGGNDSINRIVLSNVPTDVSLSVPTAGFTLSGPTLVGSTDDYTITPTGAPGTVMPELDVTAPSNMSTNFNLGVTAFSDEKSGTGGPTPEVSSSTSQNIEVDFSTVSQNPDFTSTGQSIWTSGTAFSTEFKNFLGIDYPSGFPTAPAASASTSVLGINFGGSFGLKAGFESDLNINGGTFNGQLPFNVTLGDTDNKTNNTVEISPSESQLGGGSFNTTGPGGSFQLDLIFDVFARAFGGPLSVTLATSVDTTLLKKNSSTLSGSFSLPDGIGTVAFQWPQVNTAGSNPNPGPITADGTSKPIFQVNIDPIAVVLDAILGNDPLKGSVGSLPLQLSYTILAATLAPGIDMQQAFTLNASGLTPTLQSGNGSTVPFSFGSPTIIDNPTSTNFSLGLTPDTTLSNDTSLGGQLVVGLRALKATVTIGVPGLTTTASVGPLIHVKTTFGPVTIASLYKNTFPVAFSPQNVNFSVA